jgi:hypothetical protein
MLPGGPRRNRADRRRGRGGAMSAEDTSPGATSAGPIDVGTPGPLPARRRRRGIRIAVILGIGAVLVAGAAWASANSQRIDDQFVVWNFTPSAAIKTYATRSTMTDEGRFLFYASTPVIAQESRFDKICADHQEDVGILGCYVPGDREIFLYDVTDARLDGIEEVVAAHEMLHAAWDRMSARRSNHCSRRKQRSVPTTRNSQQPSPFMPRRSPGRE